MAINSPENQSIDSRNWNNSKKSLCYNESISSSVSSKRERKQFASPYLYGDKVTLHSKVTENKMFQKKTSDLMSSFPLAANIYKASSDEFKIANRAPKRSKKSVHTLDKAPVTHPNTCTVSDMNDSEYYETKISRKPKAKAKKRRTNKKPPDKNIQIYDRDAKYCSQFNINLDSSSSDMFQHLTGDGRKVLKKSKNNYGRNQIIDNDVWTVLRNINKMQFMPSPPMSGTSVESLKNKSRRRSNDHSDASYVETCRTEEFAYISYDSTSLNSQSRSSSFDRVTVIGKQEDVTKTYTYTKNDVCKQAVVASQGKQRLPRNVNKNKTDQKDKQDLQLQLRMPTSFSLLPKNKEHILLNKDETRRTLENKIKGIVEIKTSRGNSLLKEPEKSSITSESERQEQLKGITRVVLSKVPNDSNHYCKQEVKKANIPISSLLTQQATVTKTELRRKLASLKYPIIVTGKEKLSCYTRVIDDPPQFSGLDKHIWPFMIKWLPESQRATEITTPECAKAHKANTKINGDMINNNLDAKLNNNEKTKYSKSKVNKHQISSREASSREKSLRVFKDKMINFMHSNKYSIVKSTKDNIIKVDPNSGDIETRNDRPRSILRKDKLPSPTIATTKPKYTWSKMKWASDFIENVIKKVKCGVYYAQEIHKIIKDDADAESRQTHNLADSVEDAKEYKLEDVSNGVIPGFEDTTQHLELQTVTKNQIAVKHCIANVIVQFDIAFPVDSIFQKLSIFPPPVEISDTRIVKYKATITNAMLPAELCSIIPQMLNNIDAETIPVIYNPVDSLLKELKRNELLDTIKTPPCNIHTAHLGILQNGRFPHKNRSNLILKPPNKLYFNMAIDKHLLEIDGKVLFDNITCIYRMSAHIFQKIPVHDDVEMERVNTCTALVPYVPITAADPRKQLNYTNTCVTVNLLFTNPLKYFGGKTIVSLHNSNMNNINCLYVHGVFDDAYESLCKGYDSEINLNKDRELGVCANRRRWVIRHFNKRKNYVKLCKKCKSTSCIPHYKRTTPLQRIANLDEFFQALGSAKSLAGAVDGDMERKILTSIVQMKSWTAEVTPRQALLILLLSNKKETANVVRFRNVILQGIATNRITKASELDMEMDVIEKENFDNSVQFEGISYVPASAENRDTLLEELCWIAKTTVYRLTYFESDLAIIINIQGDSL